MAELLYSAEQARELDRIAIEDFSVDSYSLMTRAGQALFELVRLRWPKAHLVQICCGAGNNGGDGYVLARLLIQAGIRVRVFSTVDVSLLKQDAQRAYDDFTAIGGTVTRDLLDADLEQSDLIVDAILGSGIDRKVRPPLAATLEKINRSGTPVLAVDVPSGLNASTGCVMGCAIRANTTLTLIGRKRGLHTLDGPDYSGEVFVNSLGVTAEVFNRLECKIQALSDSSERKNLPQRRRNSHKGSFGSLLLVGGNKGMDGAITLAANAALRSGVGLVRALVRGASRAQGMLPDVIRVRSKNRKIAGAQLRAADVIGIGPGLGQDEWAQSLFEQVIAVKTPKVLDADALNLLALEPRTVGKNCVLTPHPKEAARLLDCSIEDINADRFAAARLLSVQYDAMVVLKGCGTLISDGDAVFVCTRGNPGMAVAGMGDVLTGIISGLLAQGVAPLNAATTGVYWHAYAADCALKEQGYGLLASDLTNYMGQFRLPING